MKIPRWIHRVHAAINGYFWLPCPACGEKFGGHEWGKDGEGRSVSIPINGYWGNGMGVCSKASCIAKAIEMTDIAYQKAGIMRLSRLHSIAQSTENQPNTFPPHKPK